MKETTSSTVSLNAPEPQLANALTLHLSSVLGQNSLHHSQRWMLSFQVPLWKLCKPSLGLMSIITPQTIAPMHSTADPQQRTGASVDYGDGQVNLFSLKPQETYRCSLDSCRGLCRRQWPDYRDCRGVTCHWPRGAGEAVAFTNWALTRTQKYSDIMRSLISQLRRLTNATCATYVYPNYSQNNLIK